MTLDAWQPCHPAPDFNFADGAEADFIGELSSDGRSLKYASFVGPGGFLPNGDPDSALRLVGIDSSGDLYLIGSQSSFPGIIRYRITSRPKGSAACVASATHGYESAVSPLGLIRIRGNSIAGGPTGDTAPTIGAISAATTADWAD